MASENDDHDTESTGSADPTPVPLHVEKKEEEDKGEAGGRNGSRMDEGMDEEGMSASCCDWPPQGYESSVLRVIKEEAETAGEGGKRAVVVEEKVVLEYEGRRLVLRTLLEEDELAPLFDGAYWPGTMVWPVSLWTAEYIHHTYRKQMKGARVVELGCGCGVPGMLCHLMGTAAVALTEQPELMRIIKQNIKENFGVEEEGGREGRREEGTATANGEEKHNSQEAEAQAEISHPSSSSFLPSSSSSSSLFAAPLWWSREAAQAFLKEREWPSVDFVVCCDCIYAPFWGESYKALLACFEEFAARSLSTCIGIISVERRNGDGVDDFLACARATMEVKQVQHDEARGWFIYELRAKESLR